MLVDTACSSSLYALKIASNSMGNGECSASLLGGIYVIFYLSKTDVHGDKGILSPDKRCRAFDKNSCGTRVGEGVIRFYLEPLKRAIAEKKVVYGIIKSVASYSVGRGNGITAPTSSSQESVLRQAFTEAGILPSDISFVEALGTGTKLDDKIELSALSNVFAEVLSRKVPIGSIKTMFGHLDYAAGLIGLLKILTSFMFKTIPPTLHFKTSHAELENSQMFVPNKSMKWDENEGKSRVAGLSSFMLTGTNCHAVLAESTFQNAFIPHVGNVQNNMPLLFSGEDFSQIKRQAFLYQQLVNQTVLRHDINTISGIFFFCNCIEAETSTNIKI